MMAVENYKGEPLTPALSRKGRGGGFARVLRKNSTKAEMVFWNSIKNRQIEGLKFRRQFQIEHYIVDFICFEKRLVVEIDGGQHNESLADKERDNFLCGQNFKVLRFWNNEVLNNIEGVLAVLKQALSSPSPLAGEGWGEGYGEANAED